MMLHMVEGNLWRYILPGSSITHWKRWSACFPKRSWHFAFDPQHEHTATLAAAPGRAAYARAAFLAILCLVCPHKVEAGRVNTIALSGRLGAIVEDVPQMPSAATAADFDAVHAMAEILKRFDSRRVHIVERGPATARIELRC
jgi:hypothetical protein